jgi:MOSC domain-containing protein YiiM
MGTAVTCQAKSSAMVLLSVNIAHKQSLRIGKRTGFTGIFKRPVEEPVGVTRFGLTGDAIVSKKHHGGPDQAVYVYTLPDYAWWSQKLARELEPGTFGENLTISGLESAAMYIGDRLQLGDVELELTSPRIPCMTLESRMGIKGFATAFRDAERPGFYCRVLTEGTVRAGDPVALAARGGDITILEGFRDFYEPDISVDAIRRFLAAPIAIRARTHKEKQLATLLAARP